MDSIFQTAQGQKHMLYSMGDQVILRRVSSDFISRPINLTRDYLSSLSGVVHNSIIYYAYMTKIGTIDVRHVGSNSHIFRIEHDESHILYNPILTSLNKHLLLFYCFQNTPDNTWDAGYIVIKDVTWNNHISIADMESPDNISCILIRSVSYRPILSIINIDSHLLISIKGDVYTDSSNTRSCTENHIFELSPDLVLTSYDEMNETSKEQSQFQMKRISELQSNIETLQQAGSNMMNKISNLLQENDALKKECMSLRDENSNTKKALTIREAQIESAKKQYNELMDVAARYRDEAAKWRMKLTTR